MQRGDDHQDQSSFWPSEWLTVLDPCAPKKISNKDSSGFVKRADMLDTVHRDKKNIERTKLLASLDPDPMSHVNIGCVRATIRLFCVDERDSLDQKLINVLAQELGVEASDIDLDLIQNSGDPDPPEENSPSFVDAHILVAAKTKLEVFRVHGMMSLLIKQDGALQSALLRLGMHKNVICKMISKPKIVLSKVASAEESGSDSKAADASIKPDKTPQRRIMTNVIPAHRVAAQGHVGRIAPCALVGIGFSIPQISLMNHPRSAGIGVLFTVTCKGEVVVDRVCEGSSAFGYVLPGDVFTRVGSDEVTVASVPFLATKLTGPEQSTVGSTGPSRILPSNMRTHLQSPFTPMILFPACTDRSDAPQQAGCLAAVLEISHAGVRSLAPGSGPPHLARPARQTPPRRGPPTARHSPPRRRPAALGSAPPSAGDVRGDRACSAEDVTPPAGREPQCRRPDGFHRPDDIATRHPRGAWTARRAAPDGGCSRHPGSVV